MTSLTGVLDALAERFDLDTAAQEILVSILVICCFVGAMLAGPLSARYGRRVCMLFAAALMILCYVLILGEPTYTGLLVARCGLGLGIGLSSMVVPMYAAEVTIARQRGAVVALFQLAITGGILIAYSVSFLFALTWPWTHVLGVGVVFAVAALLLVRSLPESPHWLLAAGQSDKARAVARALGLQAGEVAQPSATELAQALREAPRHAIGSVAQESEARESGAKPVAPGSAQAVSRRSIVSVLLLCGGLFVLQNLSGIDGILYYAPHIFQTMGFDAGKAALGATLGLGLVNFLATLVALKYVDTAGRRPLLLYGAALMSVGMAMVALASVYQWSWVGLAGLCLFIMAFAVSLGPLPYVMMSELFPSSFREKGIAAASSISWLFNALIAFTFLSVVQWIGLTGVLLFFLGVCLLSWLIAYRYLPETRGASLAHIEANVLSGKRLRDLGSPESASRNPDA